MHVLKRPLLAAALLALASVPAALAQDVVQDAPESTPASEWGAEMSILKGTQSPDPAAAAAKPLDLSTTSAIKPGRVARTQPVAGVDGAPPRPRKATDETDQSYDPLGIRVGSFIVLPAVEFGTGVTSNAAGSTTGKAAALGNIAPEVTVKSDWGRHELDFGLRGTYDSYSDGDVSPKPTAHAELNARLDLPSDWTLKLNNSYDYSTQSVSSLDFPAGADKPPGVNTYTTGATLDGHLDHTLLELRTGAVRNTYEDGYAGSTVIPQGYRDNTLYSGAVRLGYQINAVVTPFVETEISRRQADQGVDPDGYRRSSTGVTLRGGILYSADPVLSGEIAFGFRHETYDDGRFHDLNAPTIDGSLIWSPTQLTKFTLRTSTSVDPTTDPNSSGSISYNASLKIEHSLRRNVSIEADLGWTRQHYDGGGETDITYEAGFGVTWKINRETWVVGKIDQQYYASSSPDGSYPTTTATIGLRLQR